MNNLELFLAGATTTAAIIISMVFWRFCHLKGDRLFGFFSIAFLLMGIERICTAFISANPESLLFLIRLAAFLLILYAILDKNRKAKKRN